MTAPALYLAPDWRGELCLWQSRPDAEPRCVHRQSDLDEIAWSIIVLALHVGIGSPEDRERRAMRRTLAEQEDRFPTGLPGGGAA